ncbi:hypothetical protein [Hymenobacter ruber]
MFEELFISAGKIRLGRLVGLISFILLMIWFEFSIPNSIGVMKQAFDQFNGASICGRITEIHLTKTGIGLSVNGSAFEFTPVLNGRSNDFKSFDAIAAINDSIVKPSYADTVHLFTKNRVYKCTFRKY